MAGNETLSARNRTPADEFYTQLTDIEAEVRHYRDQLRGKVVFCNCDDPYESSFFKFFAMNFNHLGIKKLITTCYAGSPITGEQLPLFDLAGLRSAPPPREPYRVEITEVPDLNHDGAIDMHDVEHLLRNDANVLRLLDGDGDFRSSECVALLQEADVVVTNPPFSLFQEYLSQLLESGKRFLILGDQNAVTYADVFAQIIANNVWLGYENGGIKWFQVPHAYDIKTESRKKLVDGVKYSAWVVLTGTQILTPRSATSSSRYISDICQRSTPLIPTTLRSRSPRFPTYQRTITMRWASRSPSWISTTRSSSTSWVAASPFPGPCRTSRSEGLTCRAGRASTCRRVTERIVGRTSASSSAELEKSSEDRASRDYRARHREWLCR